MDANKAALNDYLTRLDRALGAVPAADRAEIVLEIKSHLTESMEKNPSQTWHQVFSALGEPEQVANRYLLEKGLKPQRPPRSNVLKWLVIGFLGTFGIMTASSLLVLYMFTPLVKVDEASGEVKLLGGVIDIQAKDLVGKIAKGDITIGNSSGAETLAAGIEKVEIRFTAGEMHVEYNTTQEVNWDCDGMGTKAKLENHPAEKKAVLNLAGMMDCDISIPGKDIAILGSTGEVELDGIANNAEIRLNQGEVRLGIKSGVEIAYDFKVAAGEVSEVFKSSKAVGAKQVKVQMDFGQVEPLD